MKEATFYKIEDRRGWGWTIKQAKGESLPVESAILAGEIVKHLESGKTWDDAIRYAGGYVNYSEGRIYCSAR